LNAEKTLFFTKLFQRFIVYKRFNHYWRNNS
jgi:hypothetical protein